MGTNLVATHRVKDSSNNTTGFIINKQFYTDYYIKKNIEYIDNLIITKSGIIKAKKRLPEIYYKDTVVRWKYNEITKENPFKRDIQKDLKDWKEHNYKCILQLDGSRQIGKTTELKKFAYKNYEYIIYVNLATDEYDFNDLVKNGSTQIEFEKYCRKAGLPHFSNSRKTILIIDEIQVNTFVFNALRSIRSSIKCDIVITGSYLGRYFLNNINTQESRPFFSAGTITKLKMSSLSFKEFCRVFNSERKLNNINLFGKSDDKDYKELQELYNIYKEIGGYPAVIKEFISSRNMDRCYKIIEDLLATFKDESRNYFEHPKDVEVFDTVYDSILKEMCIEKRGTGKNIIDVIKNISINSMKESANLVTNKEVSNAIMWIKYCGVIDTCNLANDGDIRNIIPSRRIYFRDCGIVSYLAKKSAINKASLDGIITETFVFNELIKLFETPFNKCKVKEKLCFSLYGVYELDFMLIDTKNIIYGIEVKTNTGDPKSLKIFIDKHLINKGIVAKPTKGGHSDKFDTIPIYTVAARFPYNK